MSLISASIIMWMFFYTSSNISINSIIIFDLPRIVTTILTLDFLFFLLFFPITTAICIALSVGKDKHVDLLEIFLGITVGFLASFLLFTFSSNFLLFAMFYLVSHLILSILTYNKFKDRGNLTTLANFANSKIVLLICLSLFLTVFLIILPNQASYSEKMKVGLVNLFVGDDISNWLGTSYSISKASTVSAVNFITEKEEYQRLKNIQNTDVYNYIDFMEDLKKEVSEKTSKEEIQRIYANLDSLEVKNNIYHTISNMPLMIVFNQFFALFYAIIFATVAQLYLSIAFSLIGLLYVYIFFRVFYGKKEKED